MTLNSHKDLIVWQKSVSLTKQIYLLTNNFPKDEIYGITSQMRRAAVSVPSNIAEGYSRKNRKEYLQFLRISYGSANELETQIIIAKSLYLKINYSEAESELQEILKMLNAIINKLERSNV